MSGIARPPKAYNEPILGYAPGSPERARIKLELERMAKQIVDVPLFIGDQELATGDVSEVVMPHDHQHVLARAHRGTAGHAERAIVAAEDARKEWSRLAWEDRAAVFLKAADLITGPWRERMNASTMLGQSKTVQQAEIEAACELADFLRFNVEFYAELMQQQPLSPHGTWNRVALRPLDGFVFAVTPFNFTAIAGNLPAAPALLGNTVVWKPAPTQLRAALEIMRVFQEAGLPPGVINMIHGAPSAIGDAVLGSPELGGLAFTGSVQTFQHLFGVIGKNIGIYRQYPRIVGETGGKDFIFAHSTADLDALAVAIVRGGFEYQGQKCSACSRVYVPQSIWPELRDRVVSMTRELKVGDVRDFSNFMGAVIDAKSFKKITGYIELARTSSDCEILTGGTFNDGKGWFVQPTTVETKNPRHRLMREEIFGPVVTIHPYENKKITEALEACESSTPFALTGAIFARDRRAIAKLSEALVNAAGNFYINDKPTGAVVGQQPFGGGRLSGTNDKAGAAQNLLRWASARTIKESFVAPTDWKYPYMAPEPAR